MERRTTRTTGRGDGGLGYGVLSFGVVGPSDLVPRVADVVGRTPTLRAVRLPYRQEQEAVRIVRDNADDVDAWLFTGVVPHEIATAAEVVTLPAEHVSYSGLTLLAGLFRLSRSGGDLTRISIDTLDPDEVTETLTEADLPPDAAETMVYAPSVRSRDIVDYHRAARKDGATVAITCLRSAYDVLRKEMPVVRLAPSPHDIRAAVDALALRTRNLHHSDAQVALGFVELDKADSQLDRDLAGLGGAVVQIDAENYLLVTTRGPLERVTDDFRAAPFVGRLAERHRVVRLGFGTGRSAGEAAAHAARALARARAHGDVAAVLAGPHDADIVLTHGVETAAPAAPSDLGRLAQRLGMSRGTLRSLRGFLRTADANHVTATELAQAFAIQERSARRLLKRLERAGAAVAVGTLNEGQMGRPPVIYRVDL
ncbi:MAG TPA: hypothetical protein VE287_06240 [Actinopolymorphaceae bacterium]|jgi:hypothetical protein|nr:hypothetical protein [Actinopolymorphaceae bacterium]